MKTGVKIGLVISGLAVAGLAAYLIILKVKAAKKTKEDEKETTPGPAATPPAPAKVKTTTAPPPANTSFKPAAPAPAPKTLSMGTKIFAGSGAANAYKSNSTVGSNLYKYYAPGKYIGTYLGKDGNNAKIIVEETGFFSNSNVTVWVPSKDITY